jgi:peptide/nickel transport system substrate-binding protein
MNPVSNTSPAFIMDYFATFMLMRDEDHNIRPGLLVEWEASPEGFSGTIHPDAMWQDGKPITSEDMQWNLYAQRGDFPEFQGHLSAARFLDEIEEVQIIDDKKFFIKTTKPIIDFVSYYTGSGYHQLHQGPPHLIRERGQDFENNPSGGGPYTVKLWLPNDRVVLERWDDFWSDSPWYHKPQHEELEIILTVDAAPRFALLKSGQADMIATVPYALAKDMPRSDQFIGRGVNPGQGEEWIQLIEATGNYNLMFPNVSATIPGDTEVTLTDEDTLPFSDIRIREALELAVDKVAISEKAQFGFTKPMGGLWFTGAIGYRELPVSPYNPEKAKELLAEAGYADGFEFDLYWGAWAATPGELNWLEAAAGYWKEVGISVNIFELDDSEHIAGCCFGDPGARPRDFGPVSVMTWGRQSHSATLISYGYHRDGVYNCCYDDFTEGKWEALSETADEDEQLKIMAEIEDHILANRWVIPMAEDAMAMGYTDRVAAHPHSPFFSNSFGWLWRLVMKD